MYYQLLIEDQSGAALLAIIMEKVKQTYPAITYNIKPFHGIGHITKKNTVKETKTGKLLNDLATYLRGFNRSLQHIPSVIVVVLDNDDNDPAEFKRSLEKVAEQNKIAVDHVFCLAIEEIEAWILGDEAAILAAYPNAKQASLRRYTQDSICGTWETLADVVYNGGQKEMRKRHFSERGRIKEEWARSIGPHLDLSKNQSPSFKIFISEIYKRADIA